MLVRRRAALPAPAAQRADAIGAQLPLLESRLAEVDPLDPLAQDARRLMGKHLPELIERYERIPAAYRHQPDGEGLTADQRLVASLDAARQALGEIGDKLVQGDRQAFETHGPLHREPLQGRRRPGRRMMGFDVVGLLRQADEYLRRNMKSKAVRAAEKRRERAPVARGRGAG